MATATALRPRTFRQLTSTERQDETALVSASQSGDQYAIETLLQRYLPQVHRACRRFFLPGGTHEDLIQEGLIGVYHAISDWRPERGMHFSDYAGLCIRNQVVRAVRMATRHKHTMLSKSLSLEADSQTIVPRAATLGPEEEVLGELAVDEWRALMFTTLSELERTVLQLKAQEIDTDDVANRLGVPRKQVDNALFRARKKLSAAAATADLADTVLRSLSNPPARRSSH